MIPQTLKDKIDSALTDRSSWEIRQRDWYKLRFTGYERPKKPYPDAPDMHYPLSDIAIEKLKPFYVQQIYGQEKLANFVDQNAGENDAIESSNSLISANEIRFDNELKTRSNFEKSIHVTVDKMLNYGIVVVKTLWDNDNECLKFVPVDALYVIVPKHTASIKTTPWLVHVIRMSESQYKKNPKFKSDDDTIARIKGSGLPTHGTSELKQVEVDIREGITGTQHQDSIILWEIYWKEDPKAKTWTVSTMAPAAGIETQIADDFELPYTRGVFAKGALPFSEMTYEVASEGFYSPRGIAEILEPFELDLCKTWNFKLQWLDFNGQPTYFVNSPLANMANFTNEPGSTRPFGIERDQAVTAPMDFSVNMQFTRALAEERIQMPDLGNAEHLTGREGQKGQVTATQINAIVGLSNQSNDLRARLFKTQLGDVFTMGWDIICQYRNIEGKPALIIPSGSVDQWNKQMRTQKMIVLFQMLSGRPNVDQDELLKLVLEQDSPEMVKRLFIDSGEKAKQEQEKEAEAIALILIGFAPEVRPDEDPATRLQTLGEFAMRSLQTKFPVPMTPPLAQMILQRGEQHLAILKQQKSPQIAQLSMRFAPIAQQLQQIAQSAPPGQQMPPGGGMPTSAGAQGQQPDGNKISESISWKPSDLTSNERAQALAKMGIKADPGVNPSADAEAAKIHNETIKTATTARKALQPTTTGAQ